MGDRDAGEAAPDRDVGSFERRAGSYDDGRRGRWHREVVESVADLVVGRGPWPQAAVLDIGCGTGQLIETLAIRLPEARSLSGIDPAAAMVDIARSRCADPRARIERGTAERLPVDDRSVDLAVATLSFDHWADQPAGLREVARVLAPSGRFVLVDLMAWWFGAGRPFARRPRARTAGRLGDLARGAGLRVLEREPVYRLGPLPLVGALVAAAG